MRLRTRLVLTLFLLGVVPLLGTTVYAYRASHVAVREAIAAEAAAMADEMAAHVEAIGAGLDDTRAGAAHAATPMDEALRTTLARARERSHNGEIPFAVYADGRVFTPDPADALDLRRLSSTLIAAAPEAKRVFTLEDWTIVTRFDARSSLTLGAACPVGPALTRIRWTSARNLGLGMGVVGLTVLGILPVATRMTRRLVQLTEAAERMGQGDLGARVSEGSESGDELDRLALTFNHMAVDLAAHEARVVAQGRLLKELEICRRIQEEMLPSNPLRLPCAEIQGRSVPARQVGGDFFNYFALPTGEVALVVGDVSGKGIAAALLMANIQATLRARLPAERDLVGLAVSLDREMESDASAAYVTLFLGVLDGAAGALRYVNAGHNPPLVVRTDGRIEALDATGRPLRLFPGGVYEERRVTLGWQDVVFFYTDGLTEAENEAGELLGAGRLETWLIETRTSGPADILARVEAELGAYQGSAEALDDTTMMVLRMTPPSPAAEGPRTV